MLFKPLKPLVLAAFAISATSFASAVASPFDELSYQEAANLSGFEKIYIAPVQVALDETNVRRNVRDIRSNRPVSERDQARKAEDAYEDLIEAFDRKFTLVDQPDEDTLIVEAVLTRLESTRPTLADYDIHPQIDFSSVYAGGADFEVRLLQQDTLLVEISERHQTNLNDGRPRLGVWQDADRSMRRMASKLVKYVRSN